MTIERCALCGGSGFQKCILCGGSGLVPHDKRSDMRVECPECRGKCQVTCRGCMGSGYVEMPTFA